MLWSFTPKKRLVYITNRGRGYSMFIAVALMTVHTGITETDIAAGEGFSSLAAVWRSIAVAEKYHEKRFRAMLQNVQAGTELEAFYQSLIKTTGKTSAVRCESCGYVAEDGIIPAFCPVCGMGSDQFKKLGNE